MAAEKLGEDASDRAGHRTHKRLCSKWPRVGPFPKARSGLLAHD